MRCERFERPMLKSTTLRGCAHSVACEAGEASKTRHRAGAPHLVAAKASKTAAAATSAEAAATSAA